jgi:ribosomal protein L21E
MDLFTQLTEEAQQRHDQLAQRARQWKHEDADLYRTMERLLGDARAINQQRQAQCEQLGQLIEAQQSLKRRTTEELPQPPQAKKLKCGDVVAVYIQRSAQKPGRYYTGRVTRVVCEATDRYRLQHTVNRKPFPENPILLRPCDETKDDETNANRWHTVQ